MIKKLNLVYKEKSLFCKEKKKKKWTGGKENFNQNKWMKKQISKLLIFMIIVQATASMFFSQSYAADKTEDVNCDGLVPVCTATSPNMTKFLEFQKEAIALLVASKWKTTRQALKAWEGGLFTSEILKLKEEEDFNNSLAWIALRVLDITATRTATTLITSVFLFELAAVWALADNSIGLTILFQDRPIVRDRTKLLDIEWALSKTAYELWVVWDIWKKVANTEALNDIVKKYADDGLFKEWAHFWDSVSFMKALKQLAELNSAVKWFIAYDSLVLFENYNEDHPDLEFSEEWYKELSKEYKCARRNFGFKCNTSWASLKKNLQILTKNTNGQWKSSVKQIKQSYTDLKKALWNWTSVSDRFKKGNDLTLTDREKEILRNRYWLDAQRLTKSQWAWIISLNTNLKSQWKRLSKWVKNAISWVGSAIAEYKKMYKESKKLAKTLKQEFSGDIYVWKRISAFFWWDASSWKKSKSEWVQLYMKMKDMLDEINKSRDNMTSMVSNSNNIDLTNKYKEYLKSIEDLITSIWNKEQWLRMWLNALCTAQCWNKWNDCCYVK